MFKKKYRRMLSILLMVVMTLFSANLLISGDEMSTSDTCNNGTAEGEPMRVIPPKVISLNKHTLYMALSGTGNLSATLFSPAVGDTVVWSSSDTSVVTVDNTGTLMAANPGTAVITATTAMSYWGYSCSDTCTVTVCEVPEGIYYIGNRQNLCLIRPNNGSLTAGTYVVQHQVENLDCEKWQFILNENTGYYSIKAFSSTVSRYLTVKNNSSMLNQRIVLTDNADNAGAKWKIYKNANGSYCFIPQTGENAGGTGSHYCLMAHTTAQTNNIPINQGQETDPNTGDEWDIIISLPDPDGQNKTCWCWAASTKMVAEHNGGGSSLNTGCSVLINTSGLHSYVNREYYGRTCSGLYLADTGQRQIVVEIFWDDRNNSGNTAASQNALIYAALNDVTVELLGNVNTGLTASDKATMNSDLDDGLWLVGRLQVTNSNSTGHIVVIRSYDSNNQVYTIWNPWDDHEYQYEKEELENGALCVDYDSEYRSLVWVQRCY